MKLESGAVRSAIGLGRLPLDGPLSQIFSTYAARLLLLLVAAVLPIGVALLVVAFTARPGATAVVLAMIVSLLFISRLMLRMDGGDGASVRIRGVLLISLPLLLISSGVAIALVLVGGPSYLIVPLLGVGVATAVLVMRRIVHVTESLVTQAASRTAVAAMVASNAPHAWFRTGSGEYAQLLQGNQEQRVQQVLQALKAWCDRGESKAGILSRVSFYRLASDDLLELVATERSAGRAAPRRDFHSTRDENDRSVISLAKGSSALLVRDIDKAPPKYFADRVDRDYASLVTAPVRHEGKSYGTLCIDCDRAGGLTELDVIYALYFANRLGAALAHLSRVGIAPKSEEFSVGKTTSKPQDVPDTDSECNVLTVSLLSDDEIEWISGDLSWSEFFHRFEKTVATDVSAAIRGLRNPRHLLGPVSEGDEAIGRP